MIASVSSHGFIHLWVTPIVENWSAYAPGFEELDENREYEEKEDEFDFVRCSLPPSLFILDQEPLGPDQPENLSTLTTLGNVYFPPLAHRRTKTRSAAEPPTRKTTPSTLSRTRPERSSSNRGRTRIPPAPKRTKRLSGEGSSWTRTRTRRRVREGAARSILNRCSCPKGCLMRRR